MVNSILGLVRALLVASLAFGPNLALAQGQLPSGNVMGNSTASEKPAAPSTLTAMFDRAYCSTVGRVIARTTGSWTCAQWLPIQASYYGVVCDSVTAIDTPLRAAIVASQASGVPVQLPAGPGRCRVTTNIWVNNVISYTGLLPQADGLRLVGTPGANDATTVDTEVANGFAFSVNPESQAAALALSTITTTNSGGSLASNTYNVQINLVDGTGEIYTTQFHQIVVTGPTGKISVVLPTLHAGFTYSIYCSTTLTTGDVDHYATVGGVDATSVAGNQTVSITAVGSAHSIVRSRVFAFLRSSITDMTFSNVTAAANASAISFFRVGGWKVSNLYVTGMTADGFDLPVYLGDVDSSFQGELSNSRFDTIAGWCVKIGGTAQEISNTYVYGNYFNGCGTAPANLNTTFTLSSITNGATAVFTTSSPHTLVTNDQIYLQSLAGGTFSTLNGAFYRVTVTGASTFNLRDLTTNALIDTTSLGTYTASSGSELLAWRPPTINSTLGGGIAFGGLGSVFINNACTTTKNACLYVPENVSPDNMTVATFTAENTLGKGFYIGSLMNGSFTNLECLSATSIGATVGCMQIGTGYAAGGVKNLQVQNVKFRSDVTISSGFELLPNIAQTSPYRDTIRVRNVYWQQFVGINRFLNFIFDPIPGQPRLVITTLNTLLLASAGLGSSVPLKLAATGEWVAYQIPAAGITINTGVLTPSTFYFVYVFNSAAATDPIVGALEVSTTGSVNTDQYGVKSGDSTRTYVGALLTDAGGNFNISTNSISSNYPPGGGLNFRQGGSAVVAGQLIGYFNTALVGAVPVAAAQAYTSAGGSVPIGTTGSCVASSFVGGSTAGKFNAAVCAGGTIILSGLPAAPTGYSCNAQDQTTPADALQQTASTTTSVTFKATTVAADVVTFQCLGW